MSFPKKFEKISERKIFLSQYIEAKLPQISGLTTNTVVGIDPSIFVDLNSSQSTENSDFLISTLTDHQRHNTNCRAKVEVRRYTDKPNRTRNPSFAKTRTPAATSRLEFQ